MSYLRALLDSSLHWGREEELSGDKAIPCCTAAIKQIAGNTTLRFTPKHSACIIQKRHKKHGLSSLPVQLHVNLLGSVESLQRQIISSLTLNV